MKEYNFKITSVTRDLKARVLDDTRASAEEKLKQELVSDWELNLKEFDIELDYIHDITYRVDVRED